MKYSDLYKTDQARLNSCKEFVNERWKQLYGLETEHGKDALNFLFLANSGAAVAMLTFMGTSTEIRETDWSWTVLGLFASGVLFVGFAHAARYIRSRDLFVQWRTLVDEFFTDKKCWDDITNQDMKKSTAFDWAEKLSYVAFGLFIAGCLTGFFNAGGDHGRTKTAATVTTKQADNSATTTVDPAKEIKCSQHATAATSTKKEVKLESVGSK